MFTNTSDFSTGRMVATEEQDTDCTHMVCSILMLSGHTHLDERAQVEARDYLYEPNTGGVHKSCPKRKFYLRDFIIHIMKTTDFLPAFKHYFFSSCLVTKKLPTVGYCNLKSACKDCKQPVLRVGLI